MDLVWNSLHAWYSNDHTMHRRTGSSLKLCMVLSLSHSQNHLDTLLP